MFTSLIAPDMPLYIQAVDFDGSTNYLNRGADLTGNADGKEGTVSFWFNIPSGAGSGEDIISNDGAEDDDRFVVEKLTTPGTKLRIKGQTVGASNVLQLETSTGLNDDNWHHILSSWDLANDNKHLYIDGVNDLDEDIFVNDTIDYTKSDWTIGSKVGGTKKFTGGLAEVWFDLNYLDLSLQSNRLKFITSFFQPATLGDDGSLPTGTPPIIYQSLRSGEAATNFKTNRGSGGGFTENGTLTLAATSPSG